MVSFFLLRAKPRTEVINLSFVSPPVPKTPITIGGIARGNPLNIFYPSQTTL